MPVRRKNLKGKGVITDVVKSVAKQVLPLVVKEGSVALGNLASDKLKQKMGGSYNLASANRVRGAGEKKKMPKHQPQTRVVRQYVPPYLVN